MIKFFSKNRKIIIIAIIIIVIFLFGSNNALALTTGAAAIGLGGYALGVVGSAVSLVLSIIAYVLTAVIGLLITVVVAVLIQVAQYGNIINVPTVIEGWVIIRDLCNMLFILILLVIAFATILRVESYNYKKLLPKLLIMAILINFSRTIFGLLVDFSQVIMLTFVNSFREGGGYFMDAFRTNILFSIETDESGEFAVSSWSTAVAIIAGVLAAIITLIVVSIMLAVLVVRIIMLWIYTIFSPLIFLGFAVPGIQKYTGRIWEDFIKQLVVGPVLAFFIWLALTTADKSANLLMGQNLTSTEVCVGAGAFFCQDNFQKFIIVIGLLVGGLMVAQQTGGAVGSIAGKGMDWAKKVASVPHRGLRVSRDYAAERIHERFGVDLNLARVWAGIKEKRKEKQAERYASGMRKAEKVMAEGGIIPGHGLLAMTGTPATAWEQITSLKGLRQRFKGGKGMTREREKISPELELTKFQLAMSGLNKADRAEEMKKITKDMENNKEAIKQAEADKDTKKAEQLRSRNDTFKQKSDFLESTKGKDFTKKERDDFSGKAADLQAQYDKNIPLYDFNARAAEQDVINKKAAKIKDINEPSELLRILRDAISEKDKTMVKAITKKMTQNYDDNEFLQPLAGDTSFKGLQELMRKFSDKNDNLYAGFDRQEASSLGSEISYIARSRNHWAATGAYRMENGVWQENSEIQQAAYMSNEMGKMHPQIRARENNRLAYGYHDAKGDYHITLGGLKSLQTFDTAPQLKQFTDNVNESFLKNVATGDNMNKLRAARDKGAFKAKDDKGRDIVQIIEEAISTLVKKEVDTEDQYEKYRDIFTEKI